MSTIEEVLSTHSYEWCPKPLRICACGFYEHPAVEKGQSMQEVHRAHVAAVLQDAVRLVWDDGVRQAITWLRADYPYGDGPDWREHGCEWIADRLAEYNAATIEESDR